ARGRSSSTASWSRAAWPASTRTISASGWSSWGEARMPLINLELPADAAAVPGDVRALLREAERRIGRFQAESRVPGFVPSDFARAYRALRGVAAGLAPGNLFCEWGSGFGVVACLAALLDFDDCGIEVAGELVDAPGNSPPTSTSPWSSSTAAS